jgi:hypothetical protein
MPEIVSSSSNVPATEAQARPKPVLAYSADGVKSDVQAWLRSNGLTRSTLAAFIDKWGVRGLSVEADVLRFKSHAGGLDTALRRDGSIWALSAGAFDESLETAEQAAGLFCAIVCGDARLKVETTRGVINRMALEMSGAHGEWTEMLVTGVPRLPLGGARETMILTNGRAGIAR